MTKLRLSAFRKTLENKQADLESGNRKRDGLAIETSSDELDRIQYAGDRDQAMENLERNSGRLREVRSALLHIEAGTFGVCIDCDVEINPKRRAAVPWASPCIVCREIAEHVGDTVELAA